MHAALRRQTLADVLHRSAARHPDRLAIACGELRWTYAEFDALVSRLGGDPLTAFFAVSASAMVLLVLVVTAASSC